MAIVDWGDVPTWLATVFSGGAFLGALLLLRVEAGRDRQRQIDDRETQARLVTAWIRYARGEEGLELYLQNASSSCIYEVFVVYEAWHNIFGFEAYDLLYPTSSSPTISLVPQEALDRYGEYLPNVTASKWESMRPALYFRDSANKRWCRDKDGYLSELTDGKGVPNAVLRQYSGEREQRLSEILQRMSSGESYQALDAEERDARADRRSPQREPGSEEER